jgi:hypothetical protein
MPKLNWTKPHGFHSGDFNKKNLFYEIKFIVNFAYDSENSESDMNRRNKILRQKDKNRKYLPKKQAIFHFWI